MKFVLILLSAFMGVSSFAGGYNAAVVPRPGGYGVSYSAANDSRFTTPVSVLPNGQVGATGPVGITLPGGIAYPVIASAAVAAGALFTPWGAAIAIAVGAGSIGVAVLDQIMAAAKLRVKPGGGAMQGADSSVCSTAPCYAYQPYAGTPLFSSKSQISPWMLANGPPFEQGHASYQLSPDASQIYRLWDGGIVDRYTIISTSVAPSPAVYADISNAEAVTRVTARSPTVEEVQALIDMNLGVVLDLPVMTGPASVYKGNVVQLGLDGTVTEIEERYIASFQPGIIGIGVETKQTVTTPQRTATTVTTNPDGSQSTAVTTSPRVSSTISSTAPLPVEKPSAVTCGLPGTPACAMDERGTQSGVGTAYDAPKSAIDAAKTSAETAISGASSIVAPSWSFAFQLPTGCAPYVTGIKGVVLNVCQYQSTIHGLLSVIWAAATAFAMIGMVGRTIREA